MLQTIIEQYSEEQILKAEGFDEAIIGIDENSFKTCIFCFKMY